jgi:hypothetical protein
MSDGSEAAGLGHPRGFQCSARHRTPRPNDDLPSRRGDAERHDRACQARAGTPSSRAGRPPRGDPHLPGRRSAGRCARDREREKRRFEDAADGVEPRIIGVTFPDAYSTARERPRAALRGWPRPLPTAWYRARKPDIASRTNECRGTALRCHLGVERARVSGRAVPGSSATASIAGERRFPRCGRGEGGRSRQAGTGCVIADPRSAMMPAPTASYLAFSAAL